MTDSAKDLRILLDIRNKAGSDIVSAIERNYALAVAIGFDEGFTAFRNAIVMLSFAAVFWDQDVEAVLKEVRAIMVDIKKTKKGS